MPSALKRAEEILLGFERRVKQKTGGGGGGSSSGGNKGGVRLKRNFGIANLGRGKKVPEVVVKTPKRKLVNGKPPPENAKSVRSHLEYISRNGKVKVETKDGRTLTGNQTGKTITEEWRRKGLVEDISGYKQKLNIVLSMPKGTPPEAVLNASREFARQVFDANHEWCMALHTDTDEPHVHLAVSMMGYDGKRLNPRKGDYHQWRLLFAEKMREQGVECTATRRVHRGEYQKGKNSTVEHIEKRGGFSEINYARLEQLKEAIKTKKEPLHPFLEKQLEGQQLLLKEYKLLSRLLYQEGHKTEAKQISELARELEKSSPTTSLQDEFNEAVATGKIPERYRIYELFDEAKAHKGNIQTFIDNHELTSQEAKTLSKRLYLEGFKTEARVLGEFAKDQAEQEKQREQGDQELAI